MAKKPSAPPKESPPVSQSPDFNSLLSRPADTFKEPPPLPAGTYNGIIQNHEFGTSRQKQTPYVRFNFVLTGAGEDVEASELEGIELNKKKLHTDFYITEDSLFRLTNFLRSCGLNTNKPVAETIPETTGCEIRAFITQRMEQVQPGQPVPENPRKFNDVANISGIGG